MICQTKKEKERKENPKWDHIGVTTLELLILTFHTQKAKKKKEQNRKQKDQAKV